MIGLLCTQSSVPNGMIVTWGNVTLRYELFRGDLSQTSFQQSEQSLGEFINAHAGNKPQLSA